MKKRYYRFGDDDAQITALIVGSKKARAKFILHVPKDTDGAIIYRVIRTLDRKCRYRRNIGSEDDSRAG